MRIIIIGGSGFIGTHLATRLESNSHTIHNVSHSNGFANLAELCEHSDAVVNVAGQDIAKERWTAARKKELIASRVNTTRTIVEAISRCSVPPALISMSATGYYGNTMAPSNEGMGAGRTFLAQLCEAWEAEAMKASAFTRVVTLRMGVILDAHGGALPKLLLPFRLFVGGSIGWGKQYFSWVHRDDAIRAIEWAIVNPDAFGPYNVVAPEAVRMKQFVKTLGKVMHRPALFTVPPLMLRLILGKRADAITEGQYVVPMRLMGSTFYFNFPNLEDALRDVL
ncbi:MAG: TIGR01777 family protein [Ignavibacteria bacterium]|nr:TIGR01777 family protein [Ignavibacteria bacterium]